MLFIFNIFEHYWIFEIKLSLIDKLKQELQEGFDTRTFEDMCKLTNKMDHRKIAGMALCYGVFKEISRFKNLCQGKYGMIYF